MSYKNPNKRDGSIRAQDSFPFDVNGDPRDVFLLNGVTPASVQERLDDVIRNSRRNRKAHYAPSKHKTITEPLNPPEFEHFQHNINSQHLPNPHNRYWEPQDNERLTLAQCFPMPQKHASPNLNMKQAFVATPMQENYLAKPLGHIRRSTGTHEMPHHVGKVEDPPPYQFTNPELAQEHESLRGPMWNNGVQNTIRHQQRLLPIPPLSNNYTRSFTVTETYSAQVTNGPREMPQKVSLRENFPHHHNTAHLQGNTQKPHLPKTVTEMNEELNMTKEVGSIAKNFQMPPSKKLLRRQGASIAGEELFDTSPGYKGNPSVGIRNLPNHENCALWLMNLPPNIQAFEIFEKISTGAVSAFEISPPKGYYIMAAAKLVFKHPEAAARFIQQCDREEIYIRRRKVKARYNLYGHRRFRDDTKTRVLSVEGPSMYVEYEDLKLYFESFCDHELSDWTRLRSDVPGHSKLIWGFARIVGQATQCLEGLRAHPIYGKVLTVKYAPDPCGELYP